MKVKLARLSMEGSTIHWFNLLLETEDELSWVKLKKELIARYGGRRLENPFEELSTLRQTGSVEEFVEAFELLSSQVGRLPEEQYLGYFMSGLKAQIRRRVRTLNPSTRMQMMRIAKDVEEELKEEDDEGERRFGKKLAGDRMGRSDWYGPNSQSKNRYGSNPAQKDSKNSSQPGWSNPSQKSGSIASNANSSSSLASTGRKNESDTRSNSWKGIRSIHSDELAERRAKGLCFKCGGKYHPTLHKCPEKALRVLILGEGETVNDDGEIIAMDGELSDIEEELEVECKSMGVLGSMGGQRTMKIEGKIAEVNVLVLIDSGATHNFISPQVTTALGLNITPMAEKHIKLGDGHKIVSKGVCRDVKMQLGPIQVVVDAWVLELGGLDMVLGVSWLSTLGKVVMDWKTLSMQFMQGNQVVKLQGQGNNHGSYLNSFLGNRHSEWSTEWWWAQHQQMEAITTVVPEDIEVILKQFSGVFKECIQLPPERTKVHHIKLSPGHDSINVRPYRYPHHQKEEIEKQVSELLQAGVIQPSMSAYSSPVILVKKKDKSWRMCVDYRALNKATIPDKYPIPIVDELLDELKNVKEHQDHLSQVLSVLQTNCFVANQAKCKFGCKQIDYLGHIISGDGVAVDPEKIKCMIDWPEPKSVKGVRGFLGLTGYYRKFIKDYGKLVKPLTELTKKDNFMWGIDAKEAFQLMKTIMSSPPILILPNFDIPFEVECDAAGRGIGAVLMQKKQPIAYFSKALSEGNLAKSVYEKELMALVLCIQHWRHYLLGRQFTVFTDHKSLKHFLQQRVTSPDQQGWLAKLLGYQFEVKYKPGLENKAADALSRCYDEAELSTLFSYPTWVDSKKLLDEVAQDNEIQSLILAVQSDPDGKPGYCVKNGVLFYHGRLVISQSSPSIPLLLEEFHCTPTGGHSGFLRTYRRLAENLYWV
ncbi:enzymatic polyprotein, partial [Trifolium medium]|nr:enzymatic polyprotein [Trifolium medium]